MDLLRFAYVVPFILLLLALVAAVAYFALFRRRQDVRTDPGQGTIKRMYYYILAFVALMMAANGVARVGQYALDALFGSEVLTPSTGRLAVGISLTVVGLPLWVFYWRLIQRSVEQLPVEKSSLIRKAYLYLVLGVAIGLIIPASVDLIVWIFRAQSFNGYPWMAIVIWSIVWGFHWRVESVEGQPTPETLAVRRTYSYLVLVATLILMAVGIGRVVNIILLEGYESLASVPVFLPSASRLWQPAMRTGVALAVVGAAIWGSHWKYLLQTDASSLMRQVYLRAVTVGGVLTCLIPLGVIINGFLKWLLGTHSGETATGHFHFFPSAVASLAIGIGLWSYHQIVIRREAGDSPQEWPGTQSSFAYIMAALGLAALLAGVATLVYAALSIFSVGAGDLLAGRSFWREPIALSITLGILGIPLWGYYWRSIQRQVQAGSREGATLARRIFIFAALGAGMLAFLGSISSLLFLFLKDLLGDGLSAQTLHDVRVPIGIIAAVVLFLPYYWAVYQQDRRLMQPSGLPGGKVLQRKEVSVLADEAADAFVRNLESALRYKVDVLRWADPDAAMPELSEPQLRDLAQRIENAKGQRVLLVPYGTAVRVLSYD